MEFQWRVTKYNPRFRNRRGEYQINEWTSISDVGRLVDLASYIEVENNYIRSALRFLEETGIELVNIVGLETNNMDSAKGNEFYVHFDDIHEGKEVHRQDIEQLCRMNLREIIWCKLENNAKFFIHFGYDYYMYIGSSNPCPQSVQYAEDIGLFVEVFSSPYAST